MKCLPRPMIPSGPVPRERLLADVQGTLGARLLPHAMLARFFERVMVGAVPKATIRQAIAEVLGVQPPGAG
jgi:hypothetical protein